MTRHDTRAHSFGALPFRLVNEVVDAARMAKIAPFRPAAAARLLRAVAAAVPRARDLLRWWWSVPEVVLHVSAGRDGADIRRELALPRRRRPVAAVLELPGKGTGYLVGHSRQAVRTNRSRALRHGYQATEETDRARLRGLVHELERAGVEGYAVAGALGRIDRGEGRFWAVHGTDGRCHGLASVSVDRDVARVNGVLIPRDLDASDQRYLLASQVFIELADGARRHVITDRALRVPPGVNYLQGRLGYAPRRVRIVPAE